MARQIKPNRAAATYPLPVVAFLMGIGRNSAYDAAHDEVFPTITVRGRIVAIAGPINRLLELSGPDDPRVQEAYRLAGMGSLDGGDVPAAATAEQVEAKVPPVPKRRRIRTTPASSALEESAP
jgi:hypothetical protein